MQLGATQMSLKSQVVRLVDPSPPPPHVPAVPPAATEHDVKTSNTNAPRSFVMKSMCGRPAPVLVNWTVYQSTMPGSGIFPLAVIGMTADPPGAITPEGATTGVAVLHAFDDGSSRHSQPLDTSPSTSKYDAAHIAIPHVPPPHAPVALAGAQGTPHPPQSVSVLVERSQPLGSNASQFAKPGLHDMIAQLCVAHVGVAFARLHETAHPPQFDSELSGVSQPFAVAPSQFP